MIRANACYPFGLWLFPIHVTLKSWVDSSGFSPGEILSSGYYSLLGGRKEGNRYVSMHCTIDILNKNFPRLFSKMGNS